MEFMPAAMCKIDAIARRSRPPAPAAWQHWKLKNFWKSTGSNRVARGAHARADRTILIQEATHATINLSARKGNSPGQAQRQRLQGVPGDGRYLGSLEGMSGLRTCRLLRLVQKQTRHQAFSSDQASRDAVL